MSDLFDTLNPDIQDHLSRIGDAHPQVSLETLAAGWLEKEKIFIKQSQVLGMESAEECQDTSQGFLALTHSGSIVAVGPQTGKNRRAVYVSTEKRHTVPARSQSDQSKLSGSIKVGGPITFTAGPVKRTSPVYKLSILSSSLKPPRQNQILEEATTNLSRDFHTIDQGSSGK